MVEVARIAVADHLQGRALNTTTCLHCVNSKTTSRTSSSRIPAHLIAHHLVIAKLCVADALGTHPVSCNCAISSLASTLYVASGVNYVLLKILQKLVIMPLDGDLFCIMTPQPLDRSIKALETFRPYEHQMQRNDDRPFFNNYLLVAIRDRVGDYGLLHTARSVLESAKLSKHRQRPSYSGLDDQEDTKLPAETSSTSRAQAKINKLKRRMSVYVGAGSSAPAKLDHSVARRYPRSSARVIQLSDDGTDEHEMAAPLSVPNARSSSSRPSVQKKIPEPCNNIAEQPPLTTCAHPVQKTANRQFTDQQARCTHFVWRIDFENMEHEVRRTLKTVDTFQELLESFREEAEVVPSASRYMRAGIWSAKYKLADGSGKACFIRTSSPYSELSFDGLLRSLIEKEAWKKDPHVIVEIELKAVLPVP